MTISILRTTGELVKVRKANWAHPDAAVPGPCEQQQECKGKVVLACFEQRAKECTEHNEQERQNRQNVSQVFAEICLQTDQSEQDQWRSTESQHIGKNERPSSFSVKII